MKEIYIVETSTQPGFWELSNTTGYANKKDAIDAALGIMEASKGRIAARVKTLKIIK